MGVKHTPLTQEQFDRLHLTGWEITDIPQELWGQIGEIQRLKDTAGIMGSGSISDPKILNGISSVAGLDVLTHESNPKAGEPEGNAYHYAIQQVNDKQYPFILHGPYRAQTIVKHWYLAPDLDTYWK